MPTVSSTKRIQLLKTARAAAQAVKDEIERQNAHTIDPQVRARREPILQEAITMIQDADENIDNLEASQVGVDMDGAALDKLTELGQKLDRQIATNAFVNLGIDSLTEVLNGVSGVKTALA